jgi:hypothetical protein
MDYNKESVQLLNEIKIKNPLIGDSLWLQEFSGCQGSISLHQDFIEIFKNLSSFIHFILHL